MAAFLQVYLVVLSGPAPLRFSAARILLERFDSISAATSARFQSRLVLKFDPPANRTFLAQKAAACELVPYPKEL